MLFFVKNFSSKNPRKPNVHKALMYFCVIITRASTRLTMPVAFIVYLSPFLVGTPGDGCPYNNFTNYAVSICKGTQIIPQSKEKLLRNQQRSFRIYHFRLQQRECYFPLHILLQKSSLNHKFSD